MSNIFQIPVLFRQNLFRSEKISTIANFLIKTMNMKKFSLPFFLLIFAVSLTAQEVWLEAALKGGYGASFLVNKNILDDDSYNYHATPAYNFGGKLAVNFGPFNGISLEGFLTKAGQDFDYSLPLPLGDYENKISWKSLDALLLYRHINNRVYFELGPMYSTVRSVEQFDLETQLTNPKDNYEKNYLSGVLGFGGYVAGAETFSLGLGIRLHYGLTDFVNDKGKELGFPNPSSNYESDAVTRPAFAEFMVEFNFGIGHWARTSCSERMKFFRSGR